mmetsp:Transcript_19475/g.45357  ORF Transcript_19475/g.45357 Transcript_19475/m.45357 type:complete len:554 (+) Transcript_19475:173-1834(+)
MRISSLSTKRLILGLSLLSTTACLVVGENPVVVRQTEEFVPDCFDPICEPGQSELQIRVEPDFAFWENEWYFEKLVSRDPPEWVVVASDPINCGYCLIQETLCLEPDSVYRWTITDSNGDGFNYCGVFQLVINRNQELIYDYGAPFDEIAVAFRTPSNPKRDPAVIITDPTRSPTLRPTNHPTESVSPSESPSTSPTSSCADDESELLVSVSTSWFESENEWVLEKEDENMVWVEAESNSMPTKDTIYVDFFCLEADTKYRWTITDPSGNGIYARYYLFSVVVNEELILEDVLNDDWSEKSVIFVTPSDPTGPVLVSTPVPSVGPTESPSESHAPTTVAPSLGPSASLEPTAPPSLSPPPSLRPSANACDGEDEDLLTVEVYTDFYYYQSSWVLETRDEGSMDWTEVASNDLPRLYTAYSDRVCLEAGRSYRWTLTDTGGNGFNNYDAYYRVNLNGEEIVSPGDFECKVIKDIGPVECVDEPREHRVTNENGYGDLKYSCRQFENRLKFYGRGGLRTICNYPLTDGSGFLYDKCKVLCASEGLGPCADDDALE